MSETTEPPPEGKHPLYRIGLVTLSFANSGHLELAFAETTTETPTQVASGAGTARRLLPDLLIALPE